MGIAVPADDVPTGDGIVLNIVVGDFKWDKFDGLNGTGGGEAWKEGLAIQEGFFGIFGGVAGRKSSTFSTFSRFITDAYMCSCWSDASKVSNL